MPHLLLLMKGFSYRCEPGESEGKLHTTHQWTEGEYLMFYSSACFVIAATAVTVSLLSMWVGRPLFSVKTAHKYAVLMRMCWNIFVGVGGDGKEINSHVSL